MTKSEQHDAMREFCRRVIQAMWDCGDVDGGDVQEWAEELGLIHRKIATRADEEQFGGDICAGDPMYEFERWLTKPTPEDGLKLLANSNAR